MPQESDALLLHVAYFSTTPGMSEGRATSRGSTFPPPAICGCDGSKPSRNSRLNTSERAIKKASFRLLAPERSIEKGIAEIGPLGLVLAAERRMVGIGRGDYEHIGVRETRDKDS